MLTGVDPTIRRYRDLFLHLPSEPRCRLCSAPFGGIGGFITRRTGRRPWPKNPNFCDGCFVRFQRMPGGAEVDVMLLFADVRGSTPLSESLGSAAFGTLINRFFAVASRAIIDSGGFVEKFVGDEVTGVYLPGWAGPEFAMRAFEAGRRILRETGNGGADEPWVPVGVGLHYGRAYVGTLGTADAVSDFGVLGETANIAARLAGVAGAGELLVSEDAAPLIGVALAPSERRELSLKGVTQPVSVRVVRV